MTINLSTQRIANFSQTVFSILTNGRKKKEERRKSTHACLEILSVDSKWRLSTTLVAFAFCQQKLYQIEVGKSSLIRKKIRKKKNMFLYC